MSEHLSAERISAWLIGERGAEQRLHLQECTVCRQEVRRMEAALGGFRESVQRWSETEYAAERRLPVRAARRGVGTRSMWVGLAAAVFAICCLLLVRTPQRAVGTGADVALLEQVDAELSRTVPAPMEPLTKLMYWDADTSGSIGGRHKVQHNRSPCGWHSWGCCLV